MSHSKEVSCLSVRQPWADLLVAGIKDVENRTWRLAPKYWGKRIYIHAPKSYDVQGADWIVKYLACHAEWPEIAAHLRCSRKRLGCIVGSVKFDRVDEQADSPWSQGPMHWIVEPGSWYFFDEPFPAKGKLMIWSFDFPVTVLDGKNDK